MSSVTHGIHVVSSVIHEEYIQKTGGRTSAVSVNAPTTILHYDVTVSDLYIAGYVAVLSCCPVVLTCCKGD